MTSGSFRLRVDHYALLRNMLLKVKGVPALYLPYMYYPISKDNRNTGFLMPSYGSSTYKGQTISNAFFWAISRSQDATILHDWYSKTGQAMAGEYRYMSLGGSGNVRTDFLNEHPTTIVGTDGATGRAGRAPGVPDIRQSQPEPRRLVVRPGARRLFQRPHGRSPDIDSDISRATRRTRSYGGSASGTTKGIRITGTYDRNEYFAEDSSSSLRGNCAAHQRVPAGPAPARTARVRIGELGIRAHRTRGCSTTAHVLKPADDQVFTGSTSCRPCAFPSTSCRS